MEVAKEFERECVLFFEEVVQVFGVPRSVGQIYGLLYASPVPLSFSDIVERLEISKGSASQGMQLLRSLGAINEAKCEDPTTKSRQMIAGVGSAVDGSRRTDSSLLAREGTRNARVAYEPELSLRKLVSGILKERIAPMAVTGVGRLSRLRELAEQEPGNNFYLDRAKQLNTWRRRLTTVLPMLSVLLGPKK